MSDPANRGKFAEGETKKLLLALETKHARFCFNRNLDAHAAGGKFPAQAGDFQAFASYSRVSVETKGTTTYTLTEPYSRNFIVEIKETKLPNRLPYKNYSFDKVARVNKRVLAGTEAIVMICHMPAKQWRAVPQAFFAERDPLKPSGSWDLTRFPFIDFRATLTQFLGLAP